MARRVQLSIWAHLSLLCTIVVGCTAPHSQYPSEHLFLFNHYVPHSSSQYMHVDFIERAVVKAMPSNDVGFGLVRAAFW